MTPEILITIVFWALIWGGIGGPIGGRWKNRPVAGFVWGALLGPLGLLVIMAVPGNLATCPECRSLIPPEATRCRYCQAVIVPGGKRVIPPNAPLEAWPNDDPLADGQPIVESKPVRLSDKNTATDTDIDKWLK